MIMGFASAILSSIMNNLPTILMNALAITETSSSGLMQDTLIYANIIGADVEPKITPIGLLAALLWLHVHTQKNMRISWGRYFIIGFVLIVDVLFLTLHGLCLCLLIIYTM